MARIDDLTKAELLLVLESCPQRFWPPRPTRQNKSVLVARINSAHYASEETRRALAAAWKRKREGI